MANVEVNFLAGKMNKDFDERIVPPGQYIDALNIRIGSSEGNSVGALENSKGNTKLTSILYQGAPISENAKCIGSYEDGSNETLYWFVCDPDNVDIILSYNTNNNVIVYHIVSTSVLNFSTDYLINGINKIDDLLFWTDNLNPPRKINVTRSYPQPVLSVDQITEDDISVIVAPPLEAPSLQLYNQAGEENYMNERFISFAYRYKYKDNEYSALSQFSEIAFEPGNFEIDYSTFDNKAMQNIFNSVNISFNTGDKHVIGIDLCFKLSDSNIINVIERYNKSEQGWVDNNIQTISFNNRKIYTTLTESELLRLYDNVPRTAKSQTSMGNRLIYGNYVDGYNIDDPVNYSLDLVVEDIAYKVNTVEYSNGVNYTIDPLDTKTIEYSKIDIDLTGAVLANGSFLTISFNLVHSSFGGSTLYTADNPPLNNFSNDFVFSFQRDYVSVNDLATSQEFIDAIYTHKPYINACSGFSITDLFNCSIVSETGWSEVGSGITNINGGFTIMSSVGSNTIQIQAPAVKFTIEDPLNPGIFLFAYEYFLNSLTQSTFSLTGAKRSLHSNRDYEVAVVYMDEYNRSSTALVNTNNTIFIPANNSDKKNSIKATINNNPPSWATRYKFVVKPSKGLYQTVYTNSFFIEDTGFTWFKLDGDNRSKVQDNQTLVVKADTSGIINELIKTKVLALEAKSKDFIKDNKDENGDDIIESAGLYMKLKPSNFAAEYQENSFIDNGNVSSSGSYTQIAYPCHIPNEDFPTIPGSLPNIIYTLPAGSLIKIKLRVYRYSGVECSSRDYLIENTYIASNDYTDMYDFFTRQNIDLTAGDESGATENDNVFIPILGDWNVSQSIPTIVNTNQYQFFKDDATDSLYLVCKSGTPNCSKDGLGFLPLIGFGGNFIKVPQSRISCEITVQRATSLLIFETEAQDSDGEIYYEGSDNFAIVNGLHTGNVSNQTSTAPAVVDLNFFNCFTFGNGVESYKINDSLVGAPFYLGSRVTAVSQEEFKEADRYAGLTYSGIYNSETNLNKLNEFNLALSNWKDCEKSFGPINKLFARKTDLLVLQEDKISYVLSGKNLLSDAAAGGAITSIPEVLGTQMSRVENYGISNNPESFASRGSEVFFTDAKRNAVLNLKGSSGANAQSYAGEELAVISNFGLKNWFRDEFKNTFNNQKIGGFDPYMNEYVISTNNQLNPITPDIYECNTTISRQSVFDTYTYDVEVGTSLGDVNIDYDFPVGSANITVIYNSVEIINEEITGVGYVNFYKDLINTTRITIIIECLEESSYILTTNCPFIEDLTLVRIVYNSPASEGQTIHNNFNWSLDGFSSVYNVDYVFLEADGVSLYDLMTGQPSVGVIPVNGSTVKIQSDKFITDNFIFNTEKNNFKYLASNTLYSDKDTLYPLLNTATPILNPSTGIYESSFIYDNTLGNKYLYLVWDYTDSFEFDLCYDLNSSLLACDCNECIDCVSGDPILIADYEWENCNLDVTTYSNGDPIPQVTDPTVWESLTTGAWCYYDNDPANGPTYGKLYNWYAVNDPRGLAPIGYHVPTDAEWTVLTDYLGGATVAGGKMKEAGLCHWLTPNIDATNESLITALPGGFRYLNGTFYNIGIYGFWWSSSQDISTLPWFRGLNYNTGGVFINYGDKTYGYSVRLIKD